MSKIETILASFLASTLSLGSNLHCVMVWSLNVHQRPRVELLFISLWVLNIIIIIIIVCQWRAWERKLTHNHPMSQKSPEERGDSSRGGELVLASFPRSQHWMLNIIVNGVTSWERQVIMCQSLSGADHSLIIFNSGHDWETVESLADGEWQKKIRSRGHSPLEGAIGTLWAYSVSGPKAMGLRDHGLKTRKPWTQKSKQNLSSFSIGLPRHFVTAMEC